MTALFDTFVPLEGTGQDGAGLREMDASPTRTTPLHIINASTNTPKAVSWKRSSSATDLFRIFNPMEPSTYTPSTGQAFQSTHQSNPITPFIHTPKPTLSSQDTTTRRRRTVSTPIAPPEICRVGDDSDDPYERLPLRFDDSGADLQWSSVSLNKSFAMNGVEIVGSGLLGKGGGETSPVFQFEDEKLAMGKRKEEFALHQVQQMRSSESDGSTYGFRIDRHSPISPNGKPNGTSPTHSNSTHLWGGAKSLSPTFNGSYDNSSTTFTSGYSSGGLATASSKNDLSAVSPLSFTSTASTVHLPDSEQDAQGGAIEMEITRLLSSPHQAPRLPRSTFTPEFGFSGFAGALTHPDAGSIWTNDKRYRGEAFTSEYLPPTIPKSRTTSGIELSPGLSPLQRSGSDLMMQSPHVSASSSTTAADSIRQSPLVYRPGFESLSPLSIPTSEGIRNIWGAPDLTLAPSAFPSVGGRMPSTTSFIGGRSRNGHSASTGSIHGMGGYAEIEATFPSKLLFSEEVKQHGRGVRDLNEQMAALNFNGEYHPAFGRPVTTNQRQMSADAVYFQPRLPPMLPPPLSYSQRHDVHDNHINVDAYQPRFPSSGPDANLPIVREIQTSKLRVDESKLTRDYFESLTREGREIVMEVETGEEERRMREGVFEVVQEIARRVFPDAILHHFGSTANGFSLANSDMDLCICLRNLESQKISPAQCVEKIGHALKQAGMKDVKMLTRARVPIVKMRDPVTGIRCDVGFQNNLAIFNTRLLKTYAQIDPRFRDLVFIVKYWSKRRCINEPYFGTLSSYCYVLMIIHLLQVRGVLPCLQRICPDGTPAVPASVHPTLFPAPGPSIPPVVDVDGHDVYFYDNLAELPRHWQSRNTESLGELIVAFFKYYSAEFPYVHGVASVRAGRVLSKEEKGWTKERQQELNRSGGIKDRFWLCVEDPFEVSHNIGRPVDKETLFEVRGEFIRASKYLCAGSCGENVLAKICEKQLVPPKKAANAGAATGRKF